MTAGGLVTRTATICRALFNVLRAAKRAAYQPVLVWIDNGRIGRGVGPMDRKQRRTASRLITFVACMLALFVVAGTSAKPSTAVATPATPRPSVSAPATPTPTPTPTPEPVVEATSEPESVDLPNHVPDVVPGDGHKSRFCGRHWYC